MSCVHTQAEAAGGEMHPTSQRTKWCLDSLPDGELGQFRLIIMTITCLIWVCLYVYKLALLSLLCTSDISHLRQLDQCLNKINDWGTLGLYLDIPDWELERMEMDHDRRVAACKRAMLRHWLYTGTANKQALLLALSKMD